MELNGTDQSSGIALDWIGGDVRRILGGALEGRELTVDEGIRLTEVGGRELHALTLVADEMRRRQAGDVVTYVVNRNINFTNVCIKHCTFCAFSRDHREEEGYFLPLDEVVRRAVEAWEMGASEVCIQAGLPPKLDGSYYVDLCRAIKRPLPEMHLHAFSPEEILYGSTRSGMSIPDFLKALREAGLGTLPGTSAEILDQEIRDRIARGRITVDQWIEVITSAHRLGIRTTSTIMYGHVETSRQKAAHIGLLRDIQRETGGFIRARAAGCAEDPDGPRRGHDHRRHIRQAVARGADQRRDRGGGARTAQELPRREGPGRPRAAGDHPGAGRRARLSGRAHHGQARSHPGRDHPRAQLAARREREPSAPARPRP